MKSSCDDQRIVRLKARRSPGVSALVVRWPPDLDFDLDVMGPDDRDSDDPRRRRHVRRRRRSRRRTRCRTVTRSTAGAVVDRDDRDRGHARRSTTSRLAHAATSRAARASRPGGSKQSTRSRSWSPRRSRSGFPIEADGDPRRVHRRFQQGDFDAGLLREGVAIGQALTSPSGPIRARGRESLIRRARRTRGHWRTRRSASSPSWSRASRSG